MSVIDNYKLLKKIGSGSFGEVYYVIDNKGNELACKVEDNKQKKRLFTEYKIYKIFMAKNLNCVPRLSNYIETDKYNLMTMELLGKGLETVFEDYGNSMDVGVVLRIGKEIINIIEIIHKIGIIHRDIKPNNFMFGKENKSSLYIMDFGLSKKFFYKGKHIKYKTERSLIGTARYASINIHMGIEPSRRDDLESIGYMLIYLIKGKLPWQSVKNNNLEKKTNKLKAIGEIKILTPIDKLCSDLPDCFEKYITYTRNLEFQKCPDYNYLRSLFLDEINKGKYNTNYMWEISNNLLSN